MSLVFSESSVSVILGGNVKERTGSGWAWCGAWYGDEGRVRDKWQAVNPVLADPPNSNLPVLDEAMIGNTKQATILWRLSAAATIAQSHLQLRMEVKNVTSQTFISFSLQLFWRLSGVKSFEGDLVFCQKFWRLVWCFVKSFEGELVLEVFAGGKRSVQPLPPDPVGGPTVWMQEPILTDGRAFFIFLIPPSSFYPSRLLFIFFLSFYILSSLSSWSLSSSFYLSDLFIFYLPDPSFALFFLSSHLGQRGLTVASRRGRFLCLNLVYNLCLNLLQELCLLRCTI